MFSIKHPCVVFVLGLSTTSYPQQSNALGVFAPVPENQRAQLSKRLNLFVELNRKRQWSRVYDMFSKSYRQPTETKEHFVKQMRTYPNSRILSFVPQYASRNYTVGADYLIDGCARTRFKGRSGGSVLLKTKGKRLRAARSTQTLCAMHFQQRSNCGSGSNLLVLCRRGKGDAVSPRT